MTELKRHRENMVVDSSISLLWHSKTPHPHMNALFHGSKNVLKRGMKWIWTQSKNCYHSRWAPHLEGLPFWLDHLKTGLEYRGILITMPTTYLGIKNIALGGLFEFSLMRIKWMEWTQSANIYAKQTGTPWTQIVFAEFTTFLLDQICADHWRRKIQSLHHPFDLI